MPILQSLILVILIIIIFLILYNDKKVFLFGNQTMDTGGMDMSPQMKSRNIFNNIPTTSNNNSLFGFGNNSNNNNNNAKIFGAPINSNNGLLLGNNNTFNNSTGGLFGNQKNYFSGNDKAFSLGTKFTMGK